MRKVRMFFCLMLLGMVLSIGQAQITVQKFEEEIPICRWTYGGEGGDMSLMFYPDKEWVQTFMSPTWDRFCQHVPLVLSHLIKSLR